VATANLEDENVMKRLVSDCQVRNYKTTVREKYFFRIIKNLFFQVRGISPSSLKHLKHLRRFLARLHREKQVGRIFSQQRRKY
jgi:hypothetical protein